MLQPLEDEKLGMCMSLALFWPPRAAAPNLAAGYEDGRLAVWRLEVPLAAAAAGGGGLRTAAMLRRPLFTVKLHNEPLMALAVNSSGTGGRRSSVGVCRANNGGSWIFFAAASNVKRFRAASSALIFAASCYRSCLNMMLSEWQRGFPAGLGVLQCANAISQVC